MKNESSVEAVVIPRLERGVHTELASFHGEVGLKAVTDTGELAVRVVMAECLAAQYGERLHALLYEMIETTEAMGVGLHIV